MVHVDDLRPARPSGDGIQRGLASLLIVLLAVYGIGSAVEGIVPPVSDLGVFALHVAVVVGLAVPTVVLARAVAGVLTGASTPGTSETALAAVGAGGLGAGLLVATGGDGGGVLFGVGAGAVLLLAGLVCVEHW